MLDKMVEVHSTVCCGPFYFLITNKTHLEALKGKESVVLFLWVSAAQPGRLQLSPQGWVYGVP
jgi:hypothetical protein